jgi:hypothetical protein
VKQFINIWKPIPFNIENSFKVNFSKKLVVIVFTSLFFDLSFTNLDSLTFYKAFLLGLKLSNFFLLLSKLIWKFVIPSLCYISDKISKACYAPDEDIFFFLSMRLIFCTLGKYLFPLPIEYFLWSILYYSLQQNDNLYQ